MFDVLLPEGTNESDRNKKQKGMTSRGRGVKVHPRSQVDDKAANKRAVRRVSVETTARCNLDRLNGVQTGHVMDREDDGGQTDCGHCVVGCRGGRQQNVQGEKRSNCTIGLGYQPANPARQDSQEIDVLAWHVIIPFRCVQRSRGSLEKSKRAACALSICNTGALILASLAPRRPLQHFRL
ncbi:hypothetical protein PspLS_04812 [Pyricularia sp. CBS 133598]|nr:hypothetical protein PspLS_04812 [Pyricularia sp. CBS 133598]